MPGLSADLVVVDTDAWSHLYIGRGKPNLRVPLWRDLLPGKSTVVAVQTRAELLTGFRGSTWGRQRIEAAEARLAASATIPVDDDVIEAFVQITTAARSSGHAIQAKVHTGDRRVAATARALDAPLLAVDGIFRDVPGLSLLDEGGSS